jgi:DNA-binding transcriptional LysR family regulator
VTGPARTARFLLEPGDKDQVPRLTRFRQDHPGVTIRAGLGYWQAQLPEPDAELVITRHRLEDLLNKLDTITAPPDGS